MVYCSKDCQVASWRHGHKEECALVVSAVEALSSTSASESEHELEREARRQGPAAIDALRKAGSDAHHLKGDRDAAVMRASDVGTCVSTCAVWLVSFMQVATHTKSRRERKATRGAEQLSPHPQMTRGAHATT